MRLEAATAAFLTVFVCGCTPLRTATPAQQSSAPQVREERPVQMAPGQAEVPYLPAPTSIDLCGDPVPLDRQAVYERFDREFTLIVYNHAQVYLWLKRMQRYFPMIEERLRHYGLPGDLKYLAIAESDLLPNACSPKGAAGPWQFMAATGAAYGLKQCGSVDNRFNFQRATDSAFLLLKNLHDKYHSWALAMAAYNAGDRRVLDAMRVGGTHDYYDLCLPLETERYVMRILAIKAVLGNPGKYGYSLPTEYGYKPLQEDQVSVSLSRPAAILSIAEAAGTTYSEIKRLNPIFRSDQIPAGTYELRLPQGTRQAFERNFKPGASGSLVAQRQAVSTSARSAGPGARTVAPSRSAAVSRGAHKVKLSKAVSHEPKQKSRKISHGAGAATARAQAHSSRQRIRLAKAAPPKAKKKGKQEKATSHKGKRKAGH
ncbi:MAG: transglycosylase SLT domain-containing protein [Syntrophobacteraceae bacterium]|nr:transglycosylase SLT domain-containing protein [Syntrophobacteraceae bacterium]